MDCNLMEFRGSFSLTYEGQTIVDAKAIAVDGDDSICFRSKPKTAVHQ
ncbi:MAG: hypothetical protein IJX93_06725 [Clostridia bacterium]|nr:hypothetical protein [Clostridia bacterium]